MQLKLKIAQHSPFTRRAIVTHPLFTLIALCIMPSLGYSLGLGELHSDSHMGEQLSARINLINLPNDLDEHNIHIRQVFGEEAKAMGLHLITYWQKLDFRVEVKGAQSQIRVLSRRPVREPYANILVELKWPKGKLYREYTLLLDPAPIARVRRNAGASSNNRQALSSSAPPQNSANHTTQTLRGMVRAGEPPTFITKRDEGSDTLFHGTASIRDDSHQLIADHNLSQRDSAPRFERQTSHINETKSAPSNPKAVRYDEKDQQIARNDKSTVENNPVLRTINAVLEAIPPMWLTQSQITRQNQHIAMMEQRWLSHLHTDASAFSAVQQQLMATLQPITGGTGSDGRQHAPVAYQANMAARFTPTLDALRKVARTDGASRLWLLVAGWCLMAVLLSSYLLRFHRAVFPYLQLNTGIHNAKSQKSSRKAKRGGGFEPSLPQEPPTFALTTKPEPAEIVHVKDAVVRQHIKEKMSTYHLTGANTSNDIQMVEEIEFDPDLDAHFKR